MRIGRAVIGSSMLWGILLVCGAGGPALAGCGADRMENARLYEQCKATAAGDMYALGRCGSEQTTRYRAWEARCGVPSDPRTDTITVLPNPPAGSAIPAPGSPAPGVPIPSSPIYVPPSGTPGKLAPDGTTTYIEPRPLPPAGGAPPATAPGASAATPSAPALNVPMMKPAPAGKGKNPMFP